MTSNLIYEKDGLWHAEDRNRNRLPGSPCRTREEAQIVSDNADLCRASVRASKETTIRELGHDYDPTD